MKTTKILLATLVITLLSLPAFAQLKVAADGKVGIGTTDPGKKLEVQGVMMVNNNANYPAAKQSNFQMRTYDDPAKSFNYFLAQTDDNNNQVIFGGGAGAQYAATNIGFFTSSNRTTLLGTERMRIASNGYIRMDALATGAPLSHELSLISGDAGKPGGGPWATVSDARLKTNVHPFTDGLEKVLQIKPVFFQYKREMGYPSDKEYVGIIAQEMQKIAPYTVEERVLKFEHDGIQQGNLPGTILSYDGNAVTYMLINAIQEQQAMIDERDEKIAELESRLDKIERMLTSNDVTISNNATAVTNITLDGADAADLKQNIPNPFSGNTQINYTLPKASFSKAYIQISNLQGAVLRVVNLPQEAGPGILNIQAKDFPAGEYVYTLFVDGKVISTKKMILSN